MGYKQKVYDYDSVADAARGVEKRVDPRFHLTGRYLSQLLFTHGFRSVGFRSHNND